MMWTCKISHKDQAVLAEIMNKDPFIQSPLEEDDESEICVWWCDGYQFMNFMEGPLTKANTNAPERLVREPNTLATPYKCFIEMLSILPKNFKTICVSMT